MSFSSKKILVILGPTATGKTDLAFKLAKKFNGELISCDSRQIYTGLDIGTGKMPSKTRNLKMDDRRWIVDGVVIHLYDVVSPKIQYTVADYVKDAGKVIREIRKKGKLPIVVGGTGLYLKALLYGLSNLAISMDKKLRGDLEKLHLEQLQQKLKILFPTKWKSLNYSDKQNPRRLIRAIELESGKGSKGDKGSRSLIKEFDVLKIGLTASRDMLYKKVDERVISRIDQGMIEEAENLHKNGLSLKRMRQLGLEYGVLADYLEGNIQALPAGRQGLIKIMQGKIHGYVRRQLTWFKKEKDITWFNIADKNLLGKLENTVAKWYYSS